MYDSNKRVYCPHCGRDIDPKEKFIGNYARSEGWTPEIVQQASEETGLNIFVGKTTHGKSQDDWIGLWRQEERATRAFFDRAKELRKA